MLGSCGSLSRLLFSHPPSRLTLYRKPINSRPDNLYRCQASLSFSTSPHNTPKQKSTQPLFEGEQKDPKSFQRKFQDLLEFNTIFSDTNLTQLQDLQKKQRSRANLGLAYVVQDVERTLNDLNIHLGERGNNDDEDDIQVEPFMESEEEAKERLGLTASEQPTAKQLQVQLANLIANGAIPKAETVLNTLLSHQIPLNPQTCYAYVNILGSSHFPQQAEDFLKLVVEQHKPEGLDMNHLYSLLVFYYGKNHQAEEAVRVFRELYNHNLHPTPRSYNSLLYTLSVSNKKEQAVQLYEVMRARGIKLIGFALESYISMLVDDGSSSSLLDATVAFELSIKNDSVAITNRLIEKLLEGYAREGSDKQIEKLLVYVVDKKGRDLSPKQFALIIEGMKNAHKPEKAEKYLSDFDASKSFVPEHSYLAVLEGYMSLKQYGQAEHIISDLFHMNRLTTPVLLVLIDIFFNTGRQSEAEKIFKEIESPDDYTYSVYMSLLGKAGHLDKTNHVFQEAKSRGIASVWSYSTLIEVYVNNEQYEKAKQVFEEMVSQQILTPLAETYNLMLVCYANMKELDRLNHLLSFIKTNQIPLYNKTLVMLINVAKEHRLFDLGDKLHQIVSRRVHKQREAWKNSQSATEESEEMRVTGEVYRSLLQMYGEQLRPELSEKVLEEWKELPLHPNLPSDQQVLPETEAYNHLMKYYNEVNQSKEVERVARQLIEKRGIGEGISLSSIHILLDSYRKSSSVDQIDKCFELLQGRGLRPTAITYQLIIDTYCRAGQMKEAEEWVERAVDSGWGHKELIWFTLIRAFASAGQLNEAERIITHMRKKGIRVGLLSYNALMEGYSMVHGSDKEVIEKEEIRNKMMKVYKRMGYEGIRADRWSFVSLFEVLKRDGMRDEANYLLRDIVALGYQPHHLFH